MAGRLVERDRWKRREKERKGRKEGKKKQGIIYHLSGF